MRQRTWSLIVYDALKSFGSIRPAIENILVAYFAVVFLKKINPYHSVFIGQVFLYLKKETRTRGGKGKTNGGAVQEALKAARFGFSLGCRCCRRCQFPGDAGPERPRIQLIPEQRFLTISFGREKSEKDSEWRRCCKVRRATIHPEVFCVEEWL